MKHIFDADIAIKYGINAAIILEHLGFWIKHNEANNTNFYDDNYWTYNSVKAMKELFPYISERQINTAMKKLIDEGLVIVGNYNKSTYDRTLWYALTEKGRSVLNGDISENAEMSNGDCKNVKSIMQKCKMDTAEMSNPLCENVKPIPDNIPDINSDNKTDNTLTGKAESVSEEQAKKPTDRELTEEFNRIWEKYPRKEGRKNALRSYISARKKGTSEEQVIRGLEAYIEHIRANNTAVRYIKHGSSWFAQECWQDDYRTGQTVPNDTADWFCHG